jgi:hypothetical protein
MVPLLCGSGTNPALGRPRRFSGANVAFVATLLVVITLVPLWSVDTPPLIDYHNHLARQYIVANLPYSDHLKIFYQADWRVAPYLAMDVIVQGLAKLVSVETAGRIFLSLMFLLVGLAPIVLSLAVQGRVTPIALLGLITIHNETVRLGFVHYMFSIGFALCLLALWIRLRESRPWVRLVLFPILSTLLFFSHLIGFGIYALTVGAYELGRHIEIVRGRVPPSPLSLNSNLRSNLISLAVQFLLPLGIYGLYGPSTTVVGQNEHGGIWRKLVILQETFYYLIPSYLWTLDRILVIALPVALLLLVAMRKLEIARHMFCPLLAMFFLLLAMPANLFGGSGADHRLLPALALLLAGSLTWRTAQNDRKLSGAKTRSHRRDKIGNGTQPWPGQTTRQRPSVQPSSLPNLVAGLLQAGAGNWGRLAFGLIGILIVVRTTAITLEWRSVNREYAEYRRAFESLSDGSRVYYAFGHAGTKRSTSHPLYFLPCLAVAKKHVYLPYLFTSDSNPGINMKYTAGYERLQYLSPGPRLVDGQSPDWSAILDTYDYFILGDAQFFDIAVPGQLMPVYRGSDFAVYKNSTRNAKGGIAESGIRR